MKAIDLYRVPFTAYWKFDQQNVRCIALGESLDEVIMKQWKLSLLLLLFKADIQQEP